MVVFAEQRPKLTENLTQEVSDWVYNLRFEDLSPEVLHSVKRVCLHFIAVALAGSSGKGVGATKRSGVQPLLEFAKLHPGSCTVMGTTVTSSPQYAALANGTFGHALTLQDTHRGSVPTHIGATVYPAGFAASQMMATDFPTFATSVAVGFEITAKLAMALRPGHGTIDTIQANCLGAAAQMAKHFGLNRQQVADCLGIATFLASGTFEFLTEPGYWCRSPQVGWAAHNGIIAALLAREGLRGSPRILEAPYGFLNSFSVAPDASILDRLGNPFEVTQNGLKRYPTTRYATAEQDGLLALVRENDVRPEDVKQVTIEKPLAMHEVTGSEAQKTPPTPEIARLSSYYFAAIILLRRSAWLDALEPEVFNAPETWETVKKIRCVHAPDLDAAFPTKYTSRVTVEMTDGRTLSTVVDYPKGEPENPFSDEELVAVCNALYDYCLTDVMPRSQFDEIVSRTLYLENEKDIGAFCHLLAGRG